MFKVGDKVKFVHWLDSVMIFGTVVEIKPGETKVRANKIYHTPNEEEDWDGITYTVDKSEIYKLSKLEAALY